MCGKKFVVTWFVCIASIALPAFSQSKTGNDVFVRAEYRGFVTTRQRLDLGGPYAVVRTGCSCSRYLPTRAFVARAAKCTAAGYVAFVVRADNDNACAGHRVIPAVLMQVKPDVKSFFHRLPADSTLCFGTRVAASASEMHYDVVYLIVFLALLLVGGILLIVDAAVRLLRGR